MNSLHRNFGVPRRGPIYEPPSKFGRATICDVTPPVSPQPKPNRLGCLFLASAAIDASIIAVLAWAVWPYIRIVVQ